MIGSMKRLCILIILIIDIAFCSEDYNQINELPVLWKDFKKDIYCGMKMTDFIKHVEKCAWKGVSGSFGYSSKSRNEIGSNGDTLIIYNRCRRHILIGNEKDSAKLYVEYSDISGEWILDELWHTKKNVEYIVNNYREIKKKKNNCDELKLKKVKKREIVNPIKLMNILKPGITRNESDRLCAKNGWYCIFDSNDSKRKNGNIGKTLWQYQCLSNGLDERRLYTKYIKCDNNYNILYKYCFITGKPNKQNIIELINNCNDKVYCQKLNRIDCKQQKSNVDSMLKLLDKK